MNSHEGGTRWRSLSVIVDGIFSMAESVWRFDDDVGNDKNEDDEGNIFSIDIINCSVEFVIPDRD